MPCRFASSGTVATSRSASRAILALNVASNFLRDLVISVLHRLRQSRTLHTLTFGPISGVHFNLLTATATQEASVASSASAAKQAKSTIARTTGVVFIGRALGLTLTIPQFRSAVSNKKTARRRSHRSR